LLLIGVFLQFDNKAKLLALLLWFLRFHVTDERLFLILSVSPISAICLFSRPPILSNTSTLTSTPNHASRSDDDDVEESEIYSRFSSDEEKIEHEEEMKGTWCCGGMMTRLQLGFHFRCLSMCMYSTCM